MGFAWGLTAVGMALTWCLGGLKVLDGYNGWTTCNFFRFSCVCI